MTDLELITSPIKRIGAKIGLLSSDPNDPNKKQGIQWKEYNGLTWGQFAKTEKEEGEIIDRTWKLAQYRDTGSIFPSVYNEIECDIIKMSLKIDASSNIRRVGTLTVHMKDESYIESEFEEAWFNKLIRITIFFFDETTNQNRQFNLGCYLITNGQYTFDAEKEQLQLTLSDLMSTITEEYGSMVGTKLTIQAGNGMQSSLKSFVDQFFVYTYSDITNFNNETIPYDLEFQHGVYPYDVATKIVQLYPTYEQFYTTDGVYTVRDMTTIQQTPVLTADEMDQIVISDTGVVTPKDIKNITQVWGYELDKDYADYTATSCVTVDTNTYYLTVDQDMKVYDQGMTIAFTTSSASVNGQKINIQGIGAANIWVISSTGNQRVVEENEMQPDVQYVVKYANGIFELIGPSVIHAMAALFNKTPDTQTLNKMKQKYNCNYIRVMVDQDTRFSVQKIGERVNVLAGGQYDNIYTTQLAQERAYFENWKSARLTDSIVLKTLYVPWLDVNEVIQYRSIVTGKINKYVVNSISVDWQSFTMDIKMSRYYPYYPTSRHRYLWGDFKASTWGSHNDKMWQDIMYFEG